MSDRDLEDLEEGQFETPRQGAPSSQWRARQSSTSTSETSMLDALLAGPRRISEQFSIPRPPAPFAEDLGELPEEEAAEEEKEDFEDNVSPGGGGGDADDEIRRLREEVAHLQAANAAIRRASRAGLSAIARPPSTHADKFTRTVDVPDSDMLETQVTLSKANYGRVGSSDYRKNMLMATTPLSEKFGVAKHKVLSDLEEGDQSKNMYVQQVIVSVIHRVKEGLQRARAMDWMTICVMPHLLEVDTSKHPSTWWDNSEVCLWTDPEQVTEKEARVWQYCINKRFSEGDQVASNWLKDFVYGSSTDALRICREQEV